MASMYVTSCNFMRNIADTGLAYQIQKFFDQRPKFSDAISQRLGMFAFLMPALKPETTTDHTEINRIDDATKAIIEFSQSGNYTCPSRLRPSLYLARFVQSDSSRTSRTVQQPSPPFSQVLQVSSLHCLSIPDSDYYCVEY